MPAPTSTTLLALLLLGPALPGAARAADYRFAAEAEITGRSIGISSRFLVHDGLLNGGDASIRATNVLGIGRLRVFLDPVTDDDAPPLLQPFLQRRSEVWVGGGPGYESFSQPGSPYTILSGTLSVGGDFYVTSHVALWLRVGFNRAGISQHHPSIGSHFTDLEVAGGLALRIDDVRVGLGYVHVDTWSGSDDGVISSHDTPGWGQFQLDLQTVLRRSVALALTARIWDGDSGSLLTAGNSVGGGADGRAEWFITRNTGLALNLGGSGGAAPLTVFEMVHEYGIWSPGGPHRQFRWGGAVSHFFGPRFAILLGYFGQYEWTESNVAYPDAPMAIAHGGRLTLHARF